VVVVVVVVAAAPSGATQLRTFAHGLLRRARGRRCVHGWRAQQLQERHRRHTALAQEELERVGRLERREPRHAGDVLVVVPVLASLALRSREHVDA
jgi:hypothetical protein